MKKILSILVLMLMLLSVSACLSEASAADQSDSGSVIVQNEITQSDTAASAVEADAASSTVEVIDIPEIDYDDEDTDAQIDVSNATEIHLNGDSIQMDGAGVQTNGSVATITAAGTYLLSGTLSDGQIIVETEDSEDVFLVLDGVDITSLSSSPIYVANAEKVILNLAAGSQNTVTDSTNYVFAEGEDEPDAAVFSKDDLTISGEGTLTVNANFNHGIVSKDDLKITGGTIIVNAVNDGIKGRDSIAVLDGSITITAGGDGLQANNDEDAAEGYIVIEGGSVTINAESDGIQAETNLLVSGGNLEIVTGGGSVSTASNGGGFGGGPRDNWQQAETDEESQKGLKAGVDLTITGGTISISAYDDALHANTSINIEGGEIQLASGDDGIHADTSLTISGGTINITESYEGLESQTITIMDGTIYIVASDDGINGSDGSGGQMMGGGGGFGGTSNVSVAIHGGYVYINAGGDGLDSNGTMEMTDGVVLVNGPTNNGNGALDYMGSFNVSGGFLIAVGSAGMAQAPSSDSTQYAVLQSFSNTQAAGTLVHIEAADGESILTFAPAKEFQTIVVSSPELENGETYIVYLGGTSSGESVNGLYTGGTYTPGTAAANFTISSIITGAGNGGGMPGGGGRPGGQPNRP